MNRRLPLKMIRTLAIVTSLALGSARSQTADGESREGKFSMAFLLLHSSFEGMDVEMVNLDDKSRIGPIHIHGSDFSGSVVVAKGVYRLKPVPASPGGETIPLCRIDLTEMKPGRTIVLLEPLGKVFKPHFVNPGDRKFKVNSTRFFNTTDVPVATDLGGVRTVVPPHGNVVSAAPQKGTLPYYKVSFYYPEADSSPRQFECTRWPFRSRGRNYTFFYVNPVTHGLSQKTVEEIVAKRSEGPAP